MKSQHRQTDLNINRNHISVAISISPQWHSYYRCIRSNSCLLLDICRIYHAVMWPCKLCFYSQMPCACVCVCACVCMTVKLSACTPVCACLCACLSGVCRCCIMAGSIRESARVTQQITAAWSQPGKRLREDSGEMAAGLRRFDSNWLKCCRRNLLHIVHIYVRIAVRFIPLICSCFVWIKQF